MQVQRLVGLVMETGLPLITDKTVRKITIDAKTIARGKLPSRIQVGAIDVVAEFRNSSKQDITFRAANRQNGFAGMAQKRQDNNTKGNYS